MVTASVNVGTNAFCFCQTSLSELSDFHQFCCNLVCGYDIFSLVVAADYGHWLFSMSLALRFQFCRDSPK